MKKNNQSDGKTLTIAGTKKQREVVIRFFKLPKVKKELEKRNIKGIRERAIKRKGE